MADVVVRQSAQQGANSARFEQLREVIATETEARVTDVIRLEAKTDQNAAGITEVRQALATEEEARATAVDELTARTDKNAANVTVLTQTVTDLDSSTASRFEEISAEIAGIDGSDIRGGIQSNSIALITSTLAQVSQSTRMSVQYGANAAGIQRVDNVMADASQAVAESLRTLDASAGGGTANVTDFAKTIADFSQVSATKINSLSVTVNGQQAAIVQNAQVSADINNNLNAMYSIKVGVDAAGRQYAAGMGIGVQNSPYGMQSQVLFLADRFAVMTQAGGTVSLPFVVQNGQTFINEAFINYASITLAKVGTWYSANYVAGQTGTIMKADGTFEVNGAVSGQGRMQITNNRIISYDAQNRPAAVMGQRL
ncbi:DUF1983 domain-containing protein [Kosakonia cowanii]|uniref:DUF1983 domain-containing protein n=1 Tax=Kosakonia cowanii TaxID=208223 RepID=UPI003B97D65D